MAETQQLARSEIMNQYKQSNNDCGSPEVQVALLTDRIRHLTEHFKQHKKDNHSRRGLMIMVSKRRRLLNYLKKQSLERYQSLIKRLELRR